MSAVGVAAEHEGEAGVGGLAVDFRGVREQDGDGAGRDGVGGLVDVVCAVVVSIVDAGEVDVVLVAGDGDGLIHEHADVHVFDGGEHADGVVVAEDGVDGSADVGAEPAEGFESGIEGAEGLAAVVAGEDADVVLEAGQDESEAVHGFRVEVGVEVGDVEDGEVVEGAGEIGQRDGVGEDADFLGVSLADGVEASEFKGGFEEGVGGVPVFWMEEAPTVAEDGFVVVLDAESLAGVDMAEALLQPGEGLLVDWRRRVLAHLEFRMLILAGHELEGEEDEKARAVRGPLMAGIKPGYWCGRRSGLAGDTGGRTSGVSSLASGSGPARASLRTSSMESTKLSFMADLRFSGMSARSLRFSSGMMASKIPAR